MVGAEMATRTRHGQDYWERHLERWRKSGQTQVQYCASAGLSIKTFNRWKSRLTNAKIRKAPAIPIPNKEISLIPVRLAPPDSFGVSVDGVRDIRIRFDNGQWVVDVPSGVDSAHLGNVLKAIAGTSQ